MHNQHPIFKKWIPEKLVLPILIAALIPHVMILSLFNMNSTFTASFLDVDVDDLQFIFSLAYATIVCGLFINERLFQFFNIRSYLLFMTIINIVLMLLISLTTNTQLIYLLRVIQGTTSYLEGCIIVPLIMSRIKGEYGRLLGNTFLYGFMMTADKYTTSIVKFAIENYNFNMVIYTVIFFHVLSLLIYVFLFSHGRLYPKKPLYQLNLAGYFLMMMSLIAGAFLLIYGKRYYWFESLYIVIAFAAMLIFSGLFILQQLTSKKPIFHFEILRSERVIVGMLLFFTFYIFKSSMSNIYQVMNVVWKWHWEFVLQIQYYNCAGIYIGALFAYYIITQFQTQYKYVFFGGFFCLTSAMLWFSYILVPDTRPNAVIPPLLMEGMGQGMLFAPILQYMVCSVHANFSMNTMQAAVAMRYWSSTISFSIMQNAILFLTTKHQFLMTKNLDITNTIFQEQWNNLFNKHDTSHLVNESISLTATNLKSQLYNQALLIADIQIFRTLFYFGIVMMVFIMIYNPIKNVLHLRKKRKESH